MREFTGFIERESHNIAPTPGTLGIAYFTFSKIASKTLEGYENNSSSNVLHNIFIFVLLHHAVQQQTQRCICSTMRINSKVLCSLLLPATLKIIVAEDPDIPSPRLTKKPNILVIFADDVGTGDVPGYFERSGIVDMPNLQKLVDEGTTFTDAHSTPLCAPSRYVFLSGNYQHRGSRYPGLWNLNYKMNQFKPGQESIATVLRDNGYDTAMFGKWHLGGEF